MPRSGRIACVSGLRPRTADPPAESPSTRNTSAFDASRVWQSLSLPGIEALSSGLLRRVASRALRALMRAVAASTPLRTMSLAWAGLLSNQWLSWSVITRCTKAFVSVLPSFVLVWPSNCGSPSLTEMTAVSPSRTSSPVRFSSFSLRMPFCLP